MAADRQSGTPLPGLLLPIFAENNKKQPKNFYQNRSRAFDVTLPPLQETALVQRGQPTVVGTEQPEPMLLVCAVLCRVCRALLPVVDALVVSENKNVMSAVTRNEDVDVTISGANINQKFETKQNGVVKCGRCQEYTPIRVAPEGKRFVRCVCGCLFQTKTNKKRLICPRETCHRYLEISGPNP